MYVYQKEVHVNHYPKSLYYSYQPMSSSYRELVNYWKGKFIYNHHHLYL